jgi:hypothetical protein
MPENDKINHELAHSIEKEENEMNIDLENGNNEKYLNNNKIKLKKLI